MIFRQFFDSVSSTFTYLISSGKGREALIVDPVIEKTEEYISALDKLKLKLVKVIDTHIHADHISGIKELCKRTNCAAIMGEKSLSEVVTIRVKDNEKINIENIELTSIYTPGHTDDSYSFLMKDRIFTGDTLLINSTGRTDFQGGSSENIFESVRNKIFTYPDTTIVYPAHNYKGFTSSTIAYEKQNNPNVGVHMSKKDFVEKENNMNRPYPKRFDVAVPANLICGKQDK